jgi:hypothetical protein
MVYTVEDIPAQPRRVHVHHHHELGAGADPGHD